MNIGVLFNGVSWNIHGSLYFFISGLSWQGLSCSGLGTSCLSSVRRDSLLPDVLDNVLTINFLSYRSGESFCVNFRFSGNSGNNDFRLSSYLSCNNSWFKLYNLGSSLLSYWFGSFLPVYALSVGVAGHSVYIFGED